MNEHTFEERVRYVAYLGAIAAALKENYQYDLLELFTENPRLARRCESGFNIAFEGDVSVPVCAEEIYTAISKEQV